MLNFKDGQVSLQNLYLHVSANRYNGEAEDRAINDFFNSLDFFTQQAPAKSWKEAEPLVRLQLVHIDTAHQLKERAVILPCEFDGNLRVAVVIDYPENYLYIGSSEIKNWKVDQATVVREAQDNLWERSKSLELKLEPADKGQLLIIQPGDGYAASRILLSQFRDRLRKSLGDPYFFAIPTKNTLLCWSNDYSGAQNLPAEIRSNYESHPQSLSPDVYKCDSGTIKNCFH